MKQRYKPNEATYRKLEKFSDDEETELFVRNKPPRREIPTIEKLVEDGDTLQSLAIRYHCTIEDLKRLNNIHKENEIFAKRTIKVPHRPISMALAGVHISGASSPEEGTSATALTRGARNLNSELNTTLADLASTSKETEVNEIIFNSNIVQIPKISPTPDSVAKNYIDPVDDHSDNDELISLLPQDEISQTTVVEPPITVKMDCSGVDGGFSIRVLIVCIVLAILIFPLVWVFYIQEHLAEYHHDS